MEDLKMVSLLSTSSKMSEKCFGFSNKHCKTGSILKSLPPNKDGMPTACSICYNSTGRTQYPNYKKASDYRLNLATENPEEFVLLMSASIRMESINHFRFLFDGDVQNIDMMLSFIKIAELNPNCKFWLPTQEYKIIRDTEKIKKFPKNLVVRLSAIYVNDKPRNYKNTHTIHNTNKDFKHGKKCNAKRFEDLTIIEQKAIKPFYGAKCFDCVDCWNPKIKNVSFLRH